MTQFYVVDNLQNVYPLNIYQYIVRENLDFVDGYNPLFTIMLQETLKNTGSIANNQLSSDIVNALLKLREHPNIGGDVYWQDESVRLVLSDVISFIPVVLVSEIAVFISAGHQAGATDSQTNEILKLSPTTVGAYVKAIAEVLKQQATLTSATAIITNELLKANAVISTQEILKLIIEEYTKYTSAVLITLVDKVKETLAMTGTVSGVVGHLLSIRDLLVTQGVASSLYQSNLLLHEAITFVLLESSGKGETIHEIVRISAVYTAIFGFAANASEGIVLSSTATPSLVLHAVAEDFISLSDPEGNFNPNQLLSLLVNEGLNLRIGFNTTDGLYIGWVMNTQVGAITNYDGWNFNSFASLGDADLAASSSGLFQLNGTSDNGVPIDAAVTFATSNFGDSRLKRVQYAYIGIKANGPMYLITNTDDDIQRIYSVATTGATLKTERVTMARGVTSNYWSFELQNVAGSDFRMDELEIIPVLLTRRV